jgi:hypothetical protein
MEPCPGTGLPLAHSILSAEPAHPCKLAFAENEKETLYNPALYYQLIRILKTKPATPELIQSIAGYQSQLDLLSSVDRSNITMLENRNIVNSFFLMIFKDPAILNNPNFKQLASDTEVRIKHEEYSLYLNQINLNTLTPHQQKMVSNVVISDFQLLQDPSLLKISFEELKQKTLDALQYEIDILKHLDISRMSERKPQRQKERKAVKHYMDGQKSKAKAELKADIEAKKHERKIAKDKAESAKQVVKAVDHIREATEKLKTAMEMFGLFTVNLNKKLREAAKDPKPMTESTRAELLSDLDAASSFCDAFSSLPKLNLGLKGNQYPECDRDDNDDDRMRPN